MKKIFIIFIYIVAATLSLAAQNDSLTVVNEAKNTPLSELTPSQLWQEGNNAYVNGNYSKAIKHYLEIESRDMYSLPLYYNIANGYFKLGDVAKSLLYYYRALRLEPSDEDTKHNIEVAQSQTKDKIESIPLFILAEWNNAIRDSLSILGWSVISLVAWGLLLLFVIMFFLSRQLSKRKMGFYGALLSAIVMIITTSYALGERAEVEDSQEAIVMSQSIAVKSSPASTSTDLFILHAGTKVEVISSLEGWSKIVIADGRQGWVESRLLEVI